MYDTGLETFSMHSTDMAAGPTIAALNDEVSSPENAAPVAPADLDPETAARQYLDQILASPAVPSVSVGEAETPGTEYRTIGTQTVPLTNTTVVKFAQYRQRIPIYGSLVTIELDENNAMLAINSALGNPDDVDPVAQVSPAAAQDVIVKDAGKKVLPLPEPPRLYYYFDRASDPGVWRLVYIVKNVQRHRGTKSTNGGPAVPELFDYVIDAHTADLVAK